MVVWIKLFKEEQVVILDTNSILKLNTFLSQKQIAQVTTSIKRSLDQKRNQFCDKIYESAQEAKYRLLILFA